MRAFGYPFGELQNRPIFQNPSAKRLHGSDFVKSQIALKLLWTGIQKRQEIEFGVNFDLFFGISVLLILNFRHILAANDTRKLYISKK